MRKIISLALAACLGSMLIAGNFATGTAYAAGQYRSDPYQYSNAYYEPYYPEQLDNLLAPVALYPDPLLAQVLVASTFPDQIDDAARWMRRYGATNYRLDDQPWDVSVRAVAHYPSVLYMMDDNLDWTAALGQAYVNQPGDTIASIQSLRRLARAQGNLFSTPQQQVIVDRGYIQIVPAQPRYIFVPTYDSGAIYTRRVYNGNSFGAFFSFGSGFLIGSWLNYDLDWGSRRVIYDGWTGSGWRQRSRPYVQINNIYVNNRYQSVPINRTVVERSVNYQNVDRFNSVHHDVKFDNRARFNGRPGGQQSSNQTAQPARPNQPYQPTAQERVNQSNRGGAPAQPPAAVPQQPLQQEQRNYPGYNSDTRGGLHGGGQQGQAPNGGFNRGRGQEQVAPQQAQPQAQPAPQPPAQQAPPVELRNSPGRNNNDNRGGLRGGEQQAPNGGFNRGRGQEQAAPSPQPPAQQAPPQAPPQPPQQERQRPAQQEQRQQPAAQEQRPAQEQGQSQQERQSQQDRGNRGNGNGNGNANGKDNGKDKKDKSQ